jgi:hypothetical protein
MNRALIPYHSLYTFISILSKNGGVHPSRILRLLLNINRILLFEPIAWCETIALERKIRTHQLLKEPLFILGHWRSGSTFLQTLLSQDHRYGYLNTYKAIFPQIYFCSETLMKPIFQGLSNLSSSKNPFHRVPFSWDDADEEDTALLNSYSEYTSYWAQLFPKEYHSIINRFTFSQYEEKDIEHWENNYMYIIKKLSLYYSKPLILRSPPNTARVKQLLKLFPNAKFIYIHRNPYDVFHSNLGYWDANMKYFCFQKITNEEIEDKIFYGYKKLIGNYLEQRSAIPSTNLIEVRYEDLYSNTIEVMDKIYKQLELPDFNEIKPIVLNFINKKKSKEKTSYKYSNDIISRVDENWGFSLKEWPYDALHPGG